MTSKHSVDVSIAVQNTHSTCLINCKILTLCIRIFNPGKTLLFVLLTWKNIVDVFKNLLIINKTLMPTKMSDESVCAF